MENEVQTFKLMKAKEKAIEIISKHACLRLGEDFEKWGLRISASEIDRQSALITVREVIKETPILTPEETFIDNVCGVDFFENERFGYWQEVEKILLNLK